MKVIVYFWWLCVNFLLANGSDFPSFLHANASLAVIVDHEYMRKRNEDILSQVQKTLDDVVRENLSNGGLNVQYFAWSTVRLKKDFIAAIIVADCTNTWKIFENADQNSILLMAITDADCPRLPTKKAVMIPIIEKGEEIPQLFLDIKVQKILTWKSAVFIFDSSIGERLTQIISSLVREGPKNLYDPISIYMYKVDQKLKYKEKRNVLKEALERFSKMKKNKFIVFMKSINEIAEIAGSFKMFNVHNEWLFLLPMVKHEDDILYITQGLNEGVNIAFALNRTIENCQETLLCSVTESIFAFVTALSKIITEENLLYGQISDEEWEAIRLTKKERQEQMLTHIKNYLKDKSKCSGCSRWDFKSIESWGRSEQHNKSIHELDSRSSSGFLDVGYWSPMLGFFAKDVLFPHASHKFRNITLKVLTYDNPPWQKLTYDERGNIIGASGITIEVLKEISHKLNFTYKLQDAFVLEETYSGINENNTIKPRESLTTFLPTKLSETFAKTIVSGSFFIVAVGATIYETDRMPFNFTIPISTQTYTFISRKPDEVSRIYLFTAPFTLTSWICLVAAILVTAPVLYVINKLGPVSTLKSTGLLKITNCFWYIYGALLQQGGLYLPKADSGRVIIGVWWIVVIVIVTTYCGNLVAFLTFPKFQPGIEHLSQIFQHKDMKVFGLRNGTFFEKYSKQSSRNDFKQYMEKASLYNDRASEDIGAVRRGVRINIDWKINLQLAIQREYERTKGCDYMLAKETFVDEQIALILPGNSPYLELVNAEIKRLHQMGFMERWHQIYMPANDKCTTHGQNRQITNHMVNLDDMQGCFLVLLFGFMISGLFIAGEFWINRLYLADKKRFELFAN